MNKKNSSERTLTLYGGTYLNKGGAAIAYGTLKVLKELNVNFKCVIDPEPFFPFDTLGLVPIYRFSDTLSTNPLSSVNPIYMSKPFLKCLVNSYKSEIKMLRGNPIWHIGDSPLSDKRSVLSVIGQVVALQSLKRAVNGSVIIGGVSIDHPQTKVGDLILRRFFKKSVVHFFVRGKETYNNLIRLDVPQNRMTIICDFAFHLNKEKSKNSEKYSNLVRESDKPSIALIFREYSYGQVREKYIRGIRKLFNRLRQEYNVFFVPTSYAYLMPENDLIFVEKTLQVDPDKTINIRNYTPTEIISIFSNFDVVISARLHGAVYGALANVPTIHLYEGRKSLEVIKDIFGEMIPLIKLSDFTEDSGLNKILGIVKDLLRKKDEISSEIQSCIKSVRESSINELKYSLEEKHLLE